MDQVRSFNRTVTQRVGALDDRFLARSRPLGEARVLWEIGTEGCEVRSLRSRLGLDSGHASRLLRALERDGLVARRAPSPSDRRVRVARLTPAGVSERALLDRRSDELAASILAPLDPAQRDELVAAMRTVQRLLIDRRDRDPDGRSDRLGRQALPPRLLRRARPPLGVGLRPGARASPPSPTSSCRPPALFLVAYLRGEPVGCGAVKHHPARRPSSSGCGSPSPRAAWASAVACSPSWRRRAVRSGASAAGWRPTASLVEAIALYRSAGYVEVPAFNDEPFAHHWFEKQLV